MVTQGMIYLLGIKNRLAAIAKDMSMASNQQPATSNQQPATSNQQSAISFTLLP